MRATPTWVDMGATWPNCSASRFVEAGGQRWHVQIMGRGPALLLVHGIGAATHTWHELAPRLAQRFTVIAPDLPGHGFTTAPRTDHLSLDGIAIALAALLEELRMSPVVGVGHGAGAAIAMRLALGEDSSLRALIGINASLTPPQSQLWTLLAPAARVGVRSPRMAELGRDLESGTLDSTLMSTTGSTLSPSQAALYGVFLRSQRHMGAVMTVFEHWDAPRLQRDLDRLVIPVTLAVGLHDSWVPPHDADRIAMRLADARIVEVREGGHFAHEDVPDQLESIIVESARNAGLLAGIPVGGYD
ncbi:MAG: alpha/beta fold hydrolase [Gemmatimonadaceae bacterium]|nr:alpha/beta fold hydrolase [Gemmatimonadaceae bacterium]